MELETGGLKGRHSFSFQGDVQVPTLVFRQIAGGQGINKQLADLNLLDFLELSQQ